MADGDSTGNDSASKQSTLQSNKDSKENHEESSQEMSGWLMKRTKLSHKWRRQWFHLTAQELSYGDSAEDVKKKIPLESAEIAESNIDQKTNAFRIKPKDGKRTFYLYAEDEISQNNWMQAICFAKASGKLGDSSQACTIQ